MWGHLPTHSDTILQFGTGRFLRSFVDLFIHEANEFGDTRWDVVAVQSTGDERARQLCSGPFQVALRGMFGGERVDTVTTVHSIRRALAATTSWGEVLSVGECETLKVVVSNTTEAGLALDDADHERRAVPCSYPAKLLDVLIRRYQAGLPAITIMPCELVDWNARVLRALVLDQATRWGVDEEIRVWVGEAVTWCDTLVDRIVSAPPDDHPLLAEDPLLSVAEPFALWAVADASMPIEHPAIQVVDDVMPFSLRKVRILNGAHTALVEKALGKFVTVREAMADPETRDWLETLVIEEIVPVVDARVEDAAPFARDVFERFENPFLDHRLEDVALHQSDKVSIRLLPTYNDYDQMFGKPPALLGKAIERYL